MLPSDLGEHTCANSSCSSLSTASGQNEALGGPAAGDRVAVGVAAGTATAGRTPAGGPEGNGRLQHFFNFAFPVRMPSASIAGPLLVVLLKRSPQSCPKCLEA